jgi:hypothetical protein
VSTLDLAALIMLAVFVLGVLVLYWLWRTPPYRVRLVRSGSKTVWQLQHREDWVSLDWEAVAESEDREEIRQLAREALYAHYRFRDFINEPNSGEQRLRMISMDR